MCSENLIQTLIVAKLILIMDLKIDYHSHNSLSEVCKCSPRYYIVICVLIRYYPHVHTQVIYFTVHLRLSAIKFPYQTKLSIILINNQLDVQFLLYLFISILYMFRATLCSSSGETIVSIQNLVYVTLCRWPSSMQVGKELLVSVKFCASSRGYTLRFNVFGIRYLYY